LVVPQISYIRLILFSAKVHFTCTDFFESP
jgi:hypothetical protein